MKKDLKNPDRVYYLDILRTIAIACVILLHSITPFINRTDLFGTKSWWFCLVLNSFARAGVPLFFMISGYLLLNNPKTINIKEFYKKRFVRILLPFIVWDIIYFVYYGMIRGEQSAIDFIKELLVNGSYYHFWYVYTLVGIYLFMPFLKRIIDSCSEKALVWLLALTTFTGTIRTILNIALPVYIYLFEPLIEGYIGFVILGYVLGKADIKKPMRLIIYAGGAAGTLLSIIGNNLFSSQDKIKLLFNDGYQINHFLIAAAIFVFIKYIKIHRGNAALTLISKISGATYGIYLMHAMVLELLQRYTEISRPVYDILFNASATLLISVFVMLVVSKIKHVKKILM